MRIDARGNQQRIRAALDRVTRAKEGITVHDEHRTPGRDIVRSLAEDTLGKTLTLFHEMV